MDYSTDKKFESDAKADFLESLKKCRDQAANGKGAETTYLIGSIDDSDEVIERRKELLFGKEGELNGQEV